MSGETGRVKCKYKDKRDEQAGSTGSAGPGLISGPFI
jgi:hypothetical protein